ncbi:MAG: hypothetical protein GF411_09955 [Candidatus Lokiarchaeota archaeon]|nr:hypothetical protein [Candidatus Lokiarchaeota archaeon]
MISGEKTQNAIVISVMLIAIISGASLYSSAQYFSGANIITNFLEIDLVGLEITNLDPINRTNPRLSVSFRFQAPQVPAGSIRLSALDCDVSINGSALSGKDIGLIVPPEYRTVGSEYDETLNMSINIEFESDKNTVYNASSSGEWNFIIELTVGYSTFQSRSTNIIIQVWASDGFIV